MRIRYYYPFNSNQKEVLEFLDDQKVKYDRGEIITAFELFEDDTHFENTKEFLELHDIHATVVEATYSQKELNESTWLSCRSSWRYGYPQPDQENMGYRFTTYDSENYCGHCGKGLVQKESFVIKKEPNWGARNFLMLNWVHDELFMTRKAEALLGKANLTGFSSYAVLSTNGSNMEGVRQIYVKKILENGLSDEAIREVIICPQCNSKKYMTETGPVCYNRNVFENISDDIVKSQEKFGEITCSSMIFVSQKFYKTVTGNKLDRGLVFEPVRLIP